MLKRLLVVVCALWLSLTVTRVASALPDNVRVVYAQPFSYAVSGFSWNEAYIYVHTKNIGTPASRHVYVHYEGGSGWLDEEMTLVGSYGDHSTYRITHPSARVQFAVRYVSSAGTYWDNNDGANYKIQPYTAAGGYLPGIVGYKVALTHAVTSNYSYFTGTGWALADKLTADIAVENLSYNKQVGIRYSVNGGATWQDAAGIYQYTVNTGGGQRIEYWQVQAYGLPTAGTIQYAVYYKNTDWATEYWDNDFSQNYAHSLAAGTEIR